MNLETNEISIMDSNMKLMEVIVHNLNRTHLNQSLACEATNNNIEAPVSTVIYLDIYRKYPFILFKKKFSIRKISTRVAQVHFQFHCSVNHCGKRTLNEKKKLSQ